MQVQEALEYLADGHAILHVDTAKEVCQAIGVPFSDECILTWNSRRDASQRYQFVSIEDGPGTGVGSLELSYYVTKQLGLGAPGTAFTGKGFQAQANSRAIAQKLKQEQV
jgi:hypothetical protein